ncbi:MAG: nitroreductase family protein [Bacteroidales bacterium]|jgi:nitroreductase
MSFLELAKKRYSCRKFQDKPVEKEVMLQVLDAGRIAPSAKNKQPWHFIVIQDKQNLEKLYQVYNREWIRSAPAIIAVCGDHREAWRRADGKIHTNVDVAIAIDHLTLQATDLGLGTCWVCKFDVMKTVELLNLRDDIEPIALLPIGYPADAPNTERHEEQRKELEEIVHWEKFYFKYFKR